MWEDDPGGHRDDLDDPLVHSAVSASGGGVCLGNVLPGQGREWGVQGGLVAFDGEHVVGAALEHEMVGVAFLGVQGAVATASVRFSIRSMSWENIRISLVLASTSTWPSVGG